MKTITNRPPYRIKEKIYIRSVMDKDLIQIIKRELPSGMAKHASVVYQAGCVAGESLGKILSNLIDVAFDSLTSKTKNNE